MAKKKKSKKAVAYDSERLESASLQGNILSKINDKKQTDLLSYLNDTMSSYDDMRTYEKAKNKEYTTIDEWVDELDRCYEVEAKDTLFKQNYKGFSNFVTPDYHDAIVKIQNRMKKIFHGNSKKFSTSLDNKMYADNAELAKYLVRRSMKLSQQESKATRSYHDIASYGFSIIHTPMRITTDTYSVINNYELGSDGRPLMVGDQPVLGKDSWKELDQQSVYTDYIPVDPREIMFDPSIQDIKMQEAIFRKFRYTHVELEGLGEAEILDNIDEFLDATDMSDDWNESPDNHSENREDREYRPKVVTEVYFYYEDLLSSSGEKKKYIAVMGNKNLLLSVKECIYDTFPFINAILEESREFKSLGIGIGQVIYPMFIGLCTRLNQGFDKRTSEIIPGGFCSEKVKMGEMRPGEWKVIVGLGQTPGKQVLTTNDLMGQTSPLDRIDIDFCQSKIQGTVPALLGGSPTGTQADRTKSGLEMLLAQAQELIDTNLVDVENQLFGRYALEAYNNYVLYFRMTHDSQEEIVKTLSEWLGEEKLTYYDKKGEKHTVDFPSTMPPCSFIFSGAQAAVDKLEKLAKLRQFFQDMSELIPLAPEQMQHYMSSMDFGYVIKQYIITMDIGDVDEYFPPENLVKENEGLKQGMGQAEQKIKMGEEIQRRLAMFTEKLVQDKTEGSDKRLVGLEIEKLLGDTFDQMNSQQSSKNK